MSEKDNEEIEDRGDEFISEIDEDEELLEDDDELLDEEDEDEEDLDDDDSEEDDDFEDEDEEDLDDDEEDDGDDEKDDPRIPKSRLDQVIAQREEERRQNEWLKEQLEAVLQGKGKSTEEEVEEEDTPPEFDFDAAEIKYAEALLEGEIEEAAKIRKEINAASSAERDYQIQQARKAAASEAVNSTADSLDQRTFENTLNQYISEHDIFNEESKGYNEKAVLMANRLMASFVAEGNTRTEALKLAVNEVLPLFEKEEQSGKSKASTRSKAARKKAAKAANAQPPSTQGKATGRKSAGKLNIEKLSDRAFNKLTAREKAKLRGDIV